MTKTRVPIPKLAREQVLKEFNHRCAICGNDRPQLHHIDENPANNELHNLLPLCPNCHLVDQHNPTAPIDPAKLRLFRRYKDPVILSPQFHPLFLRLVYLLQLESTSDFEALVASSVELVAFVNALTMGAFYHARLADLVVYSGVSVWTLDEPEHAVRDRMERRAREFRDKLLVNRAQAIDLIVEMLRYQDWPNPHRSKREHVGFS